MSAIGNRITNISHRPREIEKTNRHEPIIRNKAWTGRNTGRRHSLPVYNYNNGEMRTPSNSALPSTYAANPYREAVQNITTYADQSRPIYVQSQPSQLDIPISGRGSTGAHEFGTSGNLPNPSGSVPLGPQHGFSPLTHRHGPGSYEQFPPSQRDLFFDFSQQQPAWR